MATHLCTGRVLPKGSHQTKPCESAAEPGHKLCKRHLAGIKRRQQTEAQWEDTWTRDREFSAEVADVSQRIHIELQPYMSGFARDTKRHSHVVVALDDLQRLATALETLVDAVEREHGDDHHPSDCGWRSIHTALAVARGVMRRD